MVFRSSLVPAPSSVCARYDTERASGKSSCQMIAEPTADLRDVEKRMATFYRIVSRASGKVLDVHKPDIANNGAKVQQRAYIGGSNQQWDFVEV